MTYDIFFVRRDPGQTFEDALDELESSIEEGESTELSEDDLETWAALVPRARAILGDVEVDDSEEVTRELVARDTGIELTFLSGEVEIHVPSDRSGVDELELMGTVYELARAVEDVTGLEGYDPQAGEPVSDAIDQDSPTRRRWPDETDDDGEDDAAATGPVPARPSVGDPRPEMAPDPAARPRRWWEFWRS